jgi:hypothetical protein
MDIRFFFWKGTYFRWNFFPLYLVDAVFCLPAAPEPQLPGNPPGINTIRIP